MLAGAPPRIARGKLINPGESDAAFGALTGRGVSRIDSGQECLHVLAGGFRLHGSRAAQGLWRQGSQSFVSELAPPHCRPSCGLPTRSDQKTSPSPGASSPRSTDVVQTDGRFMQTTRARAA